jgi:1-acyl-sn-glycerol-3-phosphate acyltransferase
MWMHGALPWMSRMASHGYYRVTVGGAEPPHEGPELIVANHTNSLLDVAFVVLASRRRVRFMAKAPLFTYPGLGWLVKAVGSVPVYRRQDDPKLVAQNLDTFRDVYAAIADGYALGIFPEGVSHSASHLQPLKTGAARIALGAAEKLGGRAFPIVPIGMVFADRQTFRSKALVVVGTSPQWDDLAGRGTKDREAARELTRRIEASMRAVTLNLHDWSDETIVRVAEAVWGAEFEAAADQASRVERLAVITKALAQLRLGDDGTWRSVARELRAHDRVLGRIGLTPGTLRSDTEARTAIPWLLHRLPLLLMTPVAAAGLLLFWLPRELAGRIGTWQSKKEGDDSIPTFRVMYGGVIFGIWFVLLGVASGIAAGWLAGIVTFLIMPPFALAALAVAESRRFVWQSIRRFFILRRHPERVAALRQRQHALAQRLKDLLAQSAS